MAKRIGKGDVVVIRAKVVRVWDNGLVTLHLPGFEHPVTIHEKYLDETIPAPKPAPEPKPPKEPKRRGRGKPFYDEPT
jgi:hypothetical protein